MNGARQQCTGRTVDRMDARAELMECWESLREAMELGDVSGLEALLADEYTLTQPTGTVLTKRRWLADLDADRIRYHRIEDVEVAVAGAGPAPVVTVRTITEATTDGFSSRWPLQLRTSYRPGGGSWLATGTVVTTW